MPILLGIILGVMLTVAGAFAYDTTTGRAPNGLPPSAAGGQPPIVNWDVANEHWQGVRSDLQRFGTSVENGWKRIAG